MHEAEQLYEGFRNRVEQDLVKWTDRRDREQQLLRDYERTLEMVEATNLEAKLQVDLSSGFCMQAKKYFWVDSRTSDKLVLRLLPDLHVELTYLEARKLLPELIAVHRQRLASTKREVAFIMASE
jgi:hypothetical protein